MDPRLGFGEALNLLAKIYLWLASTIFLVFHYIVIAALLLMVTGSLIFPKTAWLYKFAGVGFVIGGSLLILTMALCYLPFYKKTDRSTHPLNLVFRHFKSTSKLALAISGLFLLTGIALLTAFYTNSGRSSWPVFSDGRYHREVGFHTQLISVDQFYELSRLHTIFYADGGALVLVSVSAIMFFASPGRARCRT